MTQTTPNPSSGPAGAKRDPFERMLDRYTALPRSGKWIAVAGVALVAWLLLDSVIWPFADKLNARADNMESVLARAAARADSLPGSSADAAIVLGPNSAPRPEAETKAKLSAAVDAALKKKSITNYGFDMRTAQALPQSILSDVAARSGGQMGRLAADLRFEATPEAATAIITALDSDPAVDAISDLRVTYRKDTKRVSVQMTVEKWGIVKKTQRGGA